MEVKIQETQVSDNVDNTVGILAYVTLIGWIIAIILNSNKTGEEKSFGAFHLRQALGLMIIGFLTEIILGIILDSLIPVISIAIFIFAIIGLINAANRKKKVLPLFGEYVAKTLKRTFE